MFEPGDTQQELTNIKSFKKSPELALTKILQFKFLKRTDRGALSLGIDLFCFGGYLYKNDKTVRWWVVDNWKIFLLMFRGNQRIKFKTCYKIYSITTSNTLVRKLR